jgi:predicted dehydrogenase
MEQNAKNIRIALVGYGGGNRGADPSITGTVTHIVTQSPARVAEARTRRPNAIIVSDFGELMAQSEQWDLVHIATPNIHHFALTAAAMKAGKAVVVDKPSTVTSAQTQELIRLRDHFDVPAAVYHNRLFDGDFLLAKDIIRSGEIGRVHRVNAFFNRWDMNPTGWRNCGKPEEGGGVLYDLAGTHLFYQVRAMLGEVQSVFCTLRTLNEKAQAHDDCTLLLHFEHGIAEIGASTQVAFEYPRRFEIFGNQGALVLVGADPQGAQDLAGLDHTHWQWGSYDWNDWGVENYGLLSVPNGSGGFHTRKLKPHNGCYPEFHRKMAIATRRHDHAAVPVRLEEGLSCLKLIEAALESARTGSLVRL